MTFWINYPAPTISAISPQNVVAGLRDFRLTVTGTAFSRTSVIYWNGAPLDSSFSRTSAEMDANIQARQVTTPGQVIIAVVTPPPGGGTSNAMTLNISSPEPLAITTSMLPTTGHGKSFRFVLFATGGVLHPYYPQESYTWSVDSGQLPAGLSLHIYNGSISGTVQGSTSSFTVGVSDFSTSPTHVSRDLTIEVHPPRWP